LRRRSRDSLDETSLPGVDGTIVNNSGHDVRRLHKVIGVKYQTDIPKVSKIAQAE
jgi:hypothetical protein